VYSCGLTLKVGIAAHAVVKGFDDGFALLHGDISSPYGFFGFGSEPVDDVLGVVLHVAQDVGYSCPLLFLGRYRKTALFIDADGDHVGVPQEVMEVSEGLLVCTHQEYP
jgi:uncharacterized membrane protein